MLNDIVLPEAYNHTKSVSFGFWIGFCLAVACLAVALIFVLIERQTGRGHRENADENQISLSQIKDFPQIFWLLAILLGIVRGSIYSFNAIACGMAQTRFGFDVVHAGFLVVFFTTPI